MDIAKFLIVFVLVYYTQYTFKMIVFRKRANAVKEANQKIDVLREKKVKTLKEQKEFLNAKFPKKPKTKFKITWKRVFGFIITIFLYLAMYRGYYWLFDYVGITTVKMWQMVLFVVFFPMIANLALSKFGWQKSDLLIYLK